MMHVSRPVGSALAAIALLATLQSNAMAQVPASGQAAAAAASTPQSASEPASASYILGRDDVIEVGLLGGAGFGGRTRVQADGTIQLPFIGKIPAADKTTSELADIIRKALQSGGYFSDPVVTIEVVGFASRYVTVLGAVGSVGLIPMNRPYRLSEILARVGGIRADGASYVMVVNPAGVEKRYPIVELSTGGEAQDPYVNAGEKIYVPTAEIYYMYGQVNAPGAFPLQSEMTVQMALAKAGGLGPSGSDKKVEVTRNGKKVKLKLDDKIQAGDVLVFGERLF